MSGVAGEIACPQCGGKAYSDMETYDYEISATCTECGYIDAFYFRCGGHTLSSVMREFEYWVKIGKVVIEESNSGFWIKGFVSHDNVPHGPSALDVKVCMDCCGGIFIPRVSGHYVRCKKLGRMTVEHCDVVPDECPFRLEHIVSKANAKQENL